MAPLDFDDGVYQGAPPVTDPELEEEPEPKPVVLDKGIEPTGSSSCRYGRLYCSVGGEHRDMFVPELYAVSSRMR